MNRQLFSFAALIAPLIIVIAACAGAAPTSVKPVGGPADGENAYVYPTAAPTAAPYPGSGDGNAIPDQQQLIVYTGSLDLEVADVAASVSQAETLIKNLGGHVASSSASDTGDTGKGKSASVTYRVPAERWQEAIDGLKGLATRVVNENTSSEDVTAQVVDLDARLSNLRSTESALQGIMTRATTITDVLKVQSELTSVRGDIESLTAQRDLLANRAALATLEVGFNTPPVAEVTAASAGWDLGKEVDGALAALVRLLQGVVSLAIWLVIVAVPIFLPIIVVIWIVNRLYVRWRRTHPAPSPAAPGGQWPPSM